MVQLKSSVIIFAILCAFVNTGSALQCFSCNATSSSNSDEECEKIQTVQTCSDSNAVCGSVSYEVNVKSAIVEQTKLTTVKNCFPGSAKTGNMCAEIFKNIQETQKALNDRLGSLITMNMKQKHCSTCDEDKCNSSLRILPSFISIIFALIFVKLCSNN